LYKSPNSHLPRGIAPGEGTIPNGTRLDLTTGPLAEQLIINFSLVVSDLLGKVG
jgi:hypothetical protein